MCPGQLPERKATSTQSGHNTGVNAAEIVKLLSLEEASRSWVAWDSCAG